MDTNDRLNALEGDMKQVKVSVAAVETAQAQIMGGMAVLKWLGTSSVLAATVAAVAAIVAASLR